MEFNRKPRLGVLALMLEAYEPLFPGITAQQHAYVEEVLASLEGTAEFTFPKVALNRADIEELTARYNHEDLDGILIFLLSYSPGQYLVRAMQRNHLPLALALIQPDETVGDDFEELELTVNQGIHGSQDNANALLRAKIPCVFFAGSRLNGELKEFVTDFGAAAKTVRELQRMKIGIIGKLPGMGDVVTDDMAVYRKIGPEFVYDSIGTVTKFCDTVTPEEVAERVAYERTIFDIDPPSFSKQNTSSLLFIPIGRWPWIEFIIYTTKSFCNTVFLYIMYYLSIRLTKCQVRQCKNAEFAYNPS